jgi:hypothetical protein
MDQPWFAEQGQQLGIGATGTTDRSQTFRKSRVIDRDEARLGTLDLLNKVMSAWLRPTCGLAAAMFSTLAAITSWSLSSPPVSGSVGFWCGVVVPVGEGVGIGDSAATELVVRGADSRPLITAARPMPPATTTATVTALMSAMRDRLMNERALPVTSTILQSGPAAFAGN